MQTQPPRLAVAALAAITVACKELPAPPPQPAQIIAESGNNQSAPAGSALPTPVVVRVLDGDGAPYAGARITFTVSAGGGSIAPAEATTGADGRATAGWTLGTAASQPQTVEARLTGALSASFSATAVPGPAATIAITPSTSTLPVQGTTQLQASVTDAHANPITPPGVAWISESPTVASVSATGLVTALARGEARIRATSGSASGVAIVTVVTPPVNVADITFAFGPHETVFSWRQHRCEDLDLPDMTARAVRMTDGSIVLYSGNAPRNYASFGPTFANLRRSCTPTFASDDDHFAQSFRNQEWISTVYREGGVYHAIVHNEFHDPIHPNCKVGDTSPANPCWYNGLTYASSLNGRTFTRPTPPQHMLAGPPTRWDPTGPRAPGPYGYFTPSNIVRRDDGFYYAMFFVIPNRDNQALRGSCVMRTNNLTNPSSWRAWDGTAYSIAMPSPYEGTAPACRIVLPSDLNGSLTWNTYLERYLYVGSTAVSQDGMVKCGFAFAVSEDLITWSQPRIMKEGALPFPQCGVPLQYIGSEHYPSIIDHDDTTTNFERSGRTPWVYYMIYNSTGLDRDLRRARVTITAPGR